MYTASALTSPTSRLLVRSLTSVHCVFFLRFTAAVGMGIYVDMGMEVGSVINSNGFMGIQRGFLNRREI